MVLRFIVSIFLLLTAFVPMQASAQRFTPYTYSGKLGVGFTAESLTTFVPETVSLAFVAKYHASDNLALQGRVGVCPFLPSTLCMGGDMVLQTLIYEDPDMDVNATLGFGVTAGFILTTDSDISSPAPQLMNGTAFIGLNVQSKVQPVDFTADIGPANLHAASWDGSSARITFAVRYYF